MRNQLGILLFVNPNYTSQTDPVTGYFKNFDFSKFNTIKGSQKLLFGAHKGSIAISYDDKNDRIIFDNVINKDGRRWKIEAKNDLMRAYFDKRKKKLIKIDNMCQHFKTLFSNYGIRCDKENSDISSQIRNAKLPKAFFDDFRKEFGLLLETRVPVGGNESDKIQSPVYPFFNTDDKKDNLPQDADANGAYNIAKKAIIVLDRMKKSKSGDKINYKITNEDWAKSFD